MVREARHPSPRVLYLDTHAGRGKHLTGHLGSPLVALNTLLEHSHAKRLLRTCQFVFAFIERDEDNKVALEAEIETLGKLPETVRVRPYCGDYSDQLERLLTGLNGRIAPAFVFIDPYGFKVPGRILRNLMAAGQVEIFINVIWRELDMAIAQAKDGSAGMARILDLIFSGPEWATRIVSDDFDERAAQAIDLLAEVVGAKWATPIRMLGKNRATRYILLHLSNHDDGRDLMKDCMWRVCPDGGFYALRDSQQPLIKPEPDLAPLEEWVIDRARAGIRWHDLIDAVRPEIWRAPQVNDVVRRLRREKRIAASGYEGMFAPKANPLLTLVEA